jgi:GTP-binding protein
LKYKRLKLERLRRAFLLVDAVHGLKSSDEELLIQLRRNAISHQIILSKVDRILLPGSKTPSKSKLKSNISELEGVYRKIRAKIQPGKTDGPEALGEIISCSAEKSLERGRRPGINQVRWAVLAATGLSLDKKMLELTRFSEDGDRPAEGEISASPNTVSYVPYGSQVPSSAA